MVARIVVILGMAISGCGQSGTSVEQTSTVTETKTETEIETETETETQTQTETQTFTDTEPGCQDIRAFPNCQNGWCRIEPGTFTYGSPDTEPCRGMHTESQVEVVLTRPFVILQHEVTQAEWMAVGYENPERGDVDPQKPVAWTNQYEAMAYCNKLSDAAGLDRCYTLNSCTGTIGSGCPENFDCCLSETAIYKCTGDPHRYQKWQDCPGYRLPTVAEWEYATRAGTTTATYNGDVTTDGDLCQPEPTLEPIAWYCANSGQTLHPVCQKQPNAWGLYDTLGNAAEWADYILTGLSLEQDVGQDPPLVDPVGVAYNEENVRRVLRGGAYYREACFARSADNNEFNTVMRVIYSGFRPVRTLFE